MDWRQISTLTLANMTARYRKTWAGFLWVILNPMLTYAVQSLVFKKFLRLEIPDYALFLLGGLLPWIFITSAVDMSTPLLHNASELLKSFKIQPQTLVLAQILDNFFNFLVVFLLLLLPLLFFSQGTFGGLLFLPLALLQLIIGVVGLAWFFSVLQIFLRDTRYLVQFLTSILFFLTPIFYPESYVPSQFSWLVHLNPIYAMIKPFRACVYQYDSSLIIVSLVKGFACSLSLIFLSLYFWRKKRNEFYLYI